MAVLHRRDVLERSHVCETVTFDISLITTLVLVITTWTLVVCAKCVCVSFLVHVSVFLFVYE